MELTQILALLATATVLAGFVCAIIAIWRARTSEGAIAWAISLIAMPYLALPLFLIFGRRRFQGYVARRRSSDLIAHQAPMERQVFPDQAELSQRQLGEIKVIESLADMPFTLGNDAKLLIDGPAIFEAIFRAIDEAESYVLVQFYIIRDDDTGRQLAQKLAAAAARGLHCHLLYDEIGSHKTSDAFFEKLRRQGVQVSRFGSSTGIFNRFQLNFRNHRKIVVADGRVAFIGGANVGDEYMGLSEKFGHWRDTQVELRGPIVQAAQLSFEKDWFWATKQHLSLNWQALDAPEGDQAALVMASGPADPVETCSLFFVQAINSAVERIWIVSPYFVPDSDVLTALHLAALRGVDVRIMIPDRPDNWVVWLAAFSFFEDAVGDGVRFYRYTEGFLHQKVALLDGTAAAVGSANFDNRSFRLNFEITAVVIDPAFAKEVEEMLLRDFANCREYSVGEYESSSLFFKLAVRLARLASPIL